MIPRLLLFGLPAVQDDGLRTPVPLTRPTYLLLALALHGDWLSREELTRLLRSDDAEPSSRGSLRLLLTRARRLPWASLAPLEAEPQRVRWTALSDVRLFREAVAAQRWAQATAAYAAPLLHGLPVQGLPGLHDWLETERAALHALWLRAVHAREAELSAQQDFAGAAALLRRALALDPLSEDILQLFMTLSLRAGRRSEALLVFEHFAARLRAELNLSPLPRTLELVETARLSGMAPAPGPVPQTGPGAGLPTPLIGRAAAQRRLQAGAPVRLLAGEAGSGKTRLLQTQRGHWIRCAEGLAQLPYLPLLNAAREAQAGAQAGAPIRSNYLDVLEREQAPGAVRPGDGDSDRDQLFAALLRSFGPDQQLIFDDLHWADPGTLDWLRYAAQHGARISGAFRPDEAGAGLRATLEGLGGALELIELGPLTVPEMGTLAATFSPDVGRQAGFAEWLHGRSGGNPQFALEWLRFLRQEGALHAGGPLLAQGDAGASAQEAAPPTALPELVLRRVQRLRPAERRLLDAGSVLGGVLTPSRLARLVEQPEWEIGEALGRAARLELLDSSGRMHDTLRQALYDALPGPQRRFIHGRVVRALRGELDDLHLAEHALNADEPGEAARLWFRVARYSFGVRRGFEEEASALYRRVLALPLRSPDWYRACAYLAVRERVEGRADQARALVDTVVRESDDALARAVARAEGASLAYLEGRMDEATRLIELAAQEAAPLDDPALARDILLIQANTAHYRGEYAAALRIAEGVVEGLRREPLSHAGCNWLSTLAANLCALGRFEEALAYYREQLDAARFLGLRGQQVTASSDIIATLHDLGRIQEGVELAEAALELGQFNDTYPLRYHIALAHSRVGRHADALAQLQEVMKSASLNMRAHALALLAEVHLGLGNTGQAQAALEDGLTLAQSGDILTARGIVAVALLQFAHAPLLARARPLIDSLRPEALPAYLRGDYETALAARREAPARAEPPAPGSVLPSTS